jgi:hypothetical protein
MTDLALITCRNCGNNFTGRFCNACGEKVYTESDRSFKHLLHEAFHFLTHFEGTFLRSLKTMFRQPGRISLDFCSGIRKKYFKPLSFFLMMVILYLLFPMFEGLNMKLKFHRSHRAYREYATEKVEQVQKEKKYTDEQMEEVFHRKSEKLSKFLLFMVIPFAALVSYVMGVKKRRYFYDHFIFSTEMVSFLILFGFLIFPLLIVPLRFIKIPFTITEAHIGITIWTVLGFYIGFAARRFFGFKKYYSAIYSILFSFGMVFTLEVIYKFVLFNIAIRLV